MRVAELQQWNPQQRKLQILAAMEGLACRQVSTIDTDGMTWEEVLTAYGNRFLPPAAGQLAREQFRAAKQWQQEDITAWHTRLTELYARAFPDGNLETDVVLIEQFVLGLAHPKVMEKTLDTSPQTMQAALNSATTKLANVERVQRATGAGRRGVMSLNHPAESEEEGQIAAMGGECFHCKTTGHYRAECPLRSYPREEAQRRANQRNQPGRVGAHRGRGGGRGRGRGNGGRQPFRRGAGRGRQDNQGQGRPGRAAINAIIDAVRDEMRIREDNPGQEVQDAASYELESGN